MLFDDLYKKYINEGKKCPECGEDPCVCEDDEEEIVKEGNLPKEYIDQAKKRKGKSEKDVKKGMKAEKGECIKKDEEDTPEAEEKEEKVEKELKESSIKNLKEGRAVQDAYKQILYGKK